MATNVAIPEGFKLVSNTPPIPEGFKLVSAPQIQPLTEDQKAKSAGTDWGDVLSEGAKGFKQGLNYATGKLLSGATLGLSDKILPQEKPDFSEAPTTANVINTGLEFVGSLPTSLGIYNKVKSIPKLAKMALPVSGAVEGGLSSGIQTGDIKEAGKGALLGGAVGTALKGLQAGASLIPEGLGLTSGAGGSSVRQAYEAGKRGSKPFLESMRKGTQATDDIINLAENDFSQLGRKNYSQYKKALDEIGETDSIRLKPIRDTFNKIVTEEAGGKSYLVDDSTKKVLTKVDNMLQNFSKDSKRSLKDFDDLKQAIGKITVPLEAGNARRVQSELYRAVKDQIENQAPEYAKIMKDSAEGLELMNELKKTFSLGRKSTGDTVLRKLQSATRNNVLTNYGKREALLKQLPHGEEIADRIAGQTLNSLLPRGLEARTATLLGGGATLGGILNPSYLLASSPRLVGEMMYKTGQASRLVKPAGILSAIYTALKEKE